MRFVRFTENNDWEGETWHFYLQLDGNEELLEKLRVDLDRVYKDDHPVPYLLEDQVFDEDLVDEFLKIRGHSTYMSEHNKVVGKFNFTFKDPGVKDWEWYDDCFYKGGIKDHFTKG